MTFNPFESVKCYNYSIADDSKCELDREPLLTVHLTIVDDGGQCLFIAPSFAVVFTDDSGEPECCELIVGRFKVRMARNIGGSYNIITFGGFAIFAFPS